LAEVCLLILLARRGRNTPKLTTKNGKILAKLVAGTENDKHDNHTIIKIENTQENAEKHQNLEEMHTFYRDGQTNIYL
jgi:hypothetical protein